MVKFAPATSSSSWPPPGSGSRSCRLRSASLIPLRLLGPGSGSWSCRDCPRRPMSHPPSTRLCRSCPRRPMSIPPSSRPRAVALGLVEVAPPAFVDPFVFSAPGSVSRSCRGCPRRPLSIPPFSQPWAVAFGLVEVAPAGLCRPFCLLSPGQWLLVL